jgi:predicted nuclease with TOPRIM domain
MAMDYLANSDVIQFLLSIEVNLDLFFQALWKHVILIEFIRTKFKVDDEEKSRFVFSQIVNSFKKDPRKKKGLDYLKKWESKFWISMDENIREITRNLETNVNAELGGEVEKFASRAGYARTLSTEKRSQLQRVARKFVAPELLSDLAKVIDTLADHSTRLEPIYILIDRLDDNWIDVSIKYPLIRALIESLKSLRRITDLKTVVALRSDLLEKVILETKESGFQSEKYEDYITRLRWDSAQLKKIVNRRINYLFRHRYERQNVTFEHIFDEKVSNSGKPFSAIVDRSLMRPRDVITFVNICLQEASDKTNVTRRTFNLAERVYSANRLTAVIEEWNNVVVGASTILDQLKGKREVFTVSEFCTSNLLNDLVTKYPSSENRNLDEFWQLVDSATTRDVDPFDLAQALVSRLHLMGAIGVKIDKELPYQFFYSSQKPLLTEHIEIDTKLKVHPMLHSALGIIR